MAKTLKEIQKEIDNPTFEGLCKRLKVAKRWDFFFDSKQEANLQKEYHKLAFMLHPDRNRDKLKKSEEALYKLNELKEQADKSFKAPSYTHDNGVLAKAVVFTTQQNNYTVLRKIHDGETCTLYEGLMANKRGVVKEQPILVKTPHSAKDNDLMQREANAFLAMRKKVKDVADPAAKERVEKFTYRFPTFLESVKMKEPGQPTPRTTNVFLKPEGEWYTLEEVLAVHGSLDPQSAIWIINRMWEGLTFSHSANIIHGNLTPNHMLINAKDHIGNIVDWTASCDTTKGEKVPYVVDKYKHFYPPEILDPTGNVFASSDLYMVGCNLLYLLGGDVRDISIDDGYMIPKPIEIFINKCVQPKIKNRFNSAPDAYKAFQQVARSLYGPAKFVELLMPPKGK